MEGFKKIKLETERLILEPLSENDCAFIQELVNTPGWLKFIGDRNIHSEEDAIAYIQKINGLPNIVYWTVQMKEGNNPIGIITYIKRDYLEYNDIGFAFLPRFNHHGYAFEAAKKVLDFLVQNHQHTQILATTIPENISSIHLLQKLGLQFDKTIEVESVVLHIYKGTFN